MKVAPSIAVGEDVVYNADPNVSEVNMLLIERHPALLSLPIAV
jgi:hypothetical protein